MFETIGTLFTIAIWAVAIFLFGGGIIICIGNLISGSGFERVMAVIAIILGVITFYYTYEWLESIVWCMLFQASCWVWGTLDLARLKRLRRERSNLVLVMRF